MAKYIFVSGEGWVDRKEFTRPEPVNAPAVWGDMPEYISPLSMRPVDGRYARREEMKRFDVREVDPSERMEGDRKDPGLARKEKAYLDERASEDVSISSAAIEKLLAP